MCSLSFSTNSGLVMGTRSGDIDPYIVPYMMKESGMTMEEVSTKMDVSIEDLTKLLNNEKK